MIKVILTDIEGTISSISFVKEVLFPYARENLPEFISKHAHQSNIEQILSEVKKVVQLAHRETQKADSEITLGEVIDTLIYWIDTDKKITELKTLQGLIWEDGFKKGIFKAHIYKDALNKLQQWEKQGLPVYVYSSGSIFAQQLFFTYNEAGNILSLFSGHFDTTMGGKKEPAAYAKIAAALNNAPENILFLSDIKEELDAARIAGMKTAWIIRDGNLIQNSQHPVYADFGEIPL